MVLNEVLLKRWQAAKWLAEHGEEGKKEAYAQDAEEQLAALVKNTADWLSFYSCRVVQEAEKVREAGTAEGVAKHVDLLRHECQMVERLFGEACEVLSKEALEAVAERALALCGETAERPLA